MKDSDHSHSRQCSLGCWLKQARTNAGITITQLSSQAGIAVGQVHKLENNNVKKVNPAHLAALAGPLNLPLFRLYAAAGYPTERLPLMEGELADRLAELSPEALANIVTMVNGFTAAGQTQWNGNIVAPVSLADGPARKPTRTKEGRVDQ